MPVVRFAALVCVVVGAARAATFGTVVSNGSAFADIVLDEPRGRLYLVNTALSRVDIYNVRTRQFLSPVRTDAQPLSAALSRDGRFLYVASYDASALNIVSLDSLADVPARINLPARPEGVAVGGDNRVLISTIGAGQNNLSNVLLIYDPSGTGSLTSVAITPPPPVSPLAPQQTGGRVTLANRSYLMASENGAVIIGVNIPNTTSRAVFAYEVASGTVLRSRIVNNISSVLSVAADGSKFMAGLTLFETATLQVMAQQNAANSPWPFPQGVNFNLQQNQGGSVFSPDGSVLYSAFNTAPVQTPAARANVSQMMLSDPDNLLIRLGFQLPENLTGKMVITSDGATIFAVSESGFLTIPVGTASQNPIAIPERAVSLLLNDQCGAFAAARTQTVEVRNAGRGRMTVTAQVLQTTPAGPGAIGGGGAGGGVPGGGVIVIPPIVLPPGTTLPTPPTLPGGATTPGNAAVAATAPAIRTQNTPEGARVEMTFTAAASARNPGTVSPSHTIVLQSNEAINIPPALRAFQNFRDAESRGDIVPVEVGLSANEALEDLVLDAGRQRLYIANSGLNRVEVYDIRQRELLAPVKVGQLPRSLALTPDGSALYVANTGGETISIVNPDTLQVSGRVRIPPLPFNSTAAAMTPLHIAASQRGLQIMMNDGRLWRVVGDEAVPRPVSSAIGSAVIPGPVRSMGATPGGEYVLVMGGTGSVYLYDALVDDFIQSRQIFTTIQGYYGPISAGPRGQYYLVNGQILNQALTPVGTGTATGGRPVSAVASYTGNTFARMTQPVRANAAAIPTDRPVVEMVDVNSGAPVRASAALEGPTSTVVGTARVNINGRTMAIDPSGNTAFALTTSGVSIVPLDPQSPGDRPLVNNNGIVSLASYVPAFAPGSLISIFGRELGRSETFPGGSAPSMLGGSCVTLNNQPLPLLMTSPSQVNAQLPPDLAPGRYPLIVRSIDRKTTSTAQTLQVTRYAPAVFTDLNTKEVLLFRQDGTRVTRENPARRDESLMLFASGLGITKGPRILAGQASPSAPLAELDGVQVFFGDYRYREAEMIVEWAGLTPGFIGLYQINIRVRGDRIRGDNLPVRVRIGGTDSQTAGPVVPVVAVQ